MPVDLQPLLAGLEILEGTGPEYQGFVSNHGPMACEALVTMGLGERAPQWATHYRPQLEGPAAARFPIDPDDYREALGRVDRLGDWIELMRRQVAEHPWPTVLGRWWPRLLPGLAAAGMHGVIRTAHAVRSLTATTTPGPLLVDELAQGLAHWAARYQQLPGNPSLTGTLPLAEALARLPRLDEATESPAPGISGRMLALDALPGFTAALDRYRSAAPPDPAVADTAQSDAACHATLDELISAASRVLIARPSGAAPVAFCHTITAPAAIRLVLPHMHPAHRAPSVATAWQVLGGVVASFAPRPGDDGQDWHTDQPAPEHGTLLQRAHDSNDEHVIKLTEATLREHARTGDTALLHAATVFADRMHILLNS
ncbi:questin oxidase family protein [Streptomyces sp. NPDC017529]|uniref:questin oxidase family protein n=1 Tax=Streptomyces sp. NPDC017529 TaxID=3365000 RepID=UPI0037AE9D80